MIPPRFQGGRIIISPPLALIDACYERLVLLLAGSALEAATADIIASPDSGANRTGVPEGLIIGVVASRRARGDRIELWLGGKSPCEAAPAAWIEILKECIATELEMPEVRLSPPAFPPFICGGLISCLRSRCFRRFAPASSSATSKNNNNPQLNKTPGWSILRKHSFMGARGGGRACLMPKRGVHHVVFSPAASQCVGILCGRSSSKGLSHALPREQWRQKLEVYRRD